MVNASHNQLEIIGPGGQIEFYELDPGKGVTNIGRHPENDVVIDSPTVALFYAVLDHRKKPYHLMVLGASGNLSLPNPIHPDEVRGVRTVRRLRQGTDMRRFEP